MASVFQMTEKRWLKVLPILSSRLTLGIVIRLFMRANIIYDFVILVFSWRFICYLQRCFLDVFCIVS